MRRSKRVERYSCIENRDNLLWTKFESEKTFFLVDEENTI
jgi:hypothetical protein